MRKVLVVAACLFTACAISAALAKHDIDSEVVRERPELDIYPLQPCIREKELVVDIESPIYCGTDPPLSGDLFVFVAEWLPQFLGNC